MEFILPKVIQLEYIGVHKNKTKLQSENHFRVRKKLYINYHLRLFCRPLINPSNDFVVPNQTILLVQNPVGHIAINTCRQFEGQGLKTHSGLPMIFVREVKESAWNSPNLKCVESSHPFGNR